MTAWLEVTPETLGSGVFLRFDVQLSDTSREWSGVQAEYTLVGASVDTDQSQLYAFLSYGLLGIGDGVFKVMTDTTLGSIVSQHNVDGSTIAFALQSGSHAVGTAFYMLVDATPTSITFEDVVIADDETPAGV